MLRRICLSMAWEFLVVSRPPNGGVQDLLIGNVLLWRQLVHFFQDLLLMCGERGGVHLVRRSPDHRFTLIFYDRPRRGFPLRGLFY